MAHDLKPKAFVKAVLLHAMENPQFTQLARQKEQEEAQRRHAEHLEKRTVYRYRKLL